MNHTVPSPPRTVCVLGLGYIGLPTSAVLARRGHHVFGVDVRPEVVETINRGEVHIHEPLLPELVAEVVRDGRLQAAGEPQPADVFMICVPTPTTENHAPNLAYVEAAARAIRPHVRRGSLIILESTSPPRTTSDIVAPNAVPSGWRVGRDVFVAHCPERVLPGRILKEVIENDRIVGGVTPACTAQAAAFYEDFVSGKVLQTSAITAELTKLTENSFRDVNIAFANELSMLAEDLGADPLEVIELANRHPRVNILTPGPGVGGHCISVDPWFLVHAAPERTKLIRAAREVNDYKPTYVVEQVRRLTARHSVRKLGILGLTYKADIDDLRESPSLDIALELTRRGAADTVLACDPFVTAAAVPELQLRGLEELLATCEMLVLLTDHQPFRNIPESALRGKILLDTRGVWRRPAGMPAARRAA